MKKLDFHCTSASYEKGDQTLVLSKKQKAPYSIDGVNPFSTLISLTLYPVPIEISEKTVDIIRASCIAIPFLGVITQKCLVLERIGLLEEIALISDQA